jgi:hypothetical protein
MKELSGYFTLGINVGVATNWKKERSVVSVALSKTYEIFLGSRPTR